MYVKLETVLNKLPVVGKIRAKRRIEIAQQKTKQEQKFWQSQYGQLLQSGENLDATMRNPQVPYIVYDDDF